MSEPKEPRLVAVSRRYFLRTALVGGTAVAVAACGNNDADVLAGEATTDTADAAAADEATSSTESPTTEAAAAETSTTEVTETIEAVAAGLTVAEMLVSFSYTSDGTGKRENPYIAVWVETPAGDLVDTVALWYEQSDKGDKWLKDLRTWFDVSGDGGDTTMSSATRAAGDYTVAWDLTTIDGAAVTAGEYVLFVESSREHGPHHITSTELTLTDGATASELGTSPLADDGELHDLSVAWA